MCEVEEHRNRESLAMKNATILIAEGDEILRQNLKRRLLPHGFEVI